MYKIAFFYEKRAMYRTIAFARAAFAARSSSSDICVEGESLSEGVTQC